jgi:AraC family transcriptional regulator, regulatory protein of adaptative response / DNA-3-methyladenine glycosylase II
MERSLLSAPGRRVVKDSISAAGAQVWTDPDRPDALSGSVPSPGSTLAYNCGVTTYSAVATTGIYCRPGCGARPLAENVRTFELAAAAEAAGYRACLRCRPYRVAEPVSWDAPEFVCRAVQLVIGGALDDGTEAELGQRLGMSARHLRRLFNEHLGVTPDQLARSRRVHFARRLLDDSELPIIEIAYASGFGSLRQFNRAMREIFRSSPRELRARRRRTDRLATDGGLTLRLPYQPPFDWHATTAFLAARAIPGVESVGSDSYRRTIVLDGDPGMLELLPGGADHLLLRAHLPHWEGLIHVVEKVARMAGLDTDIAEAERQLALDPLLGPRIRAHPGRRVPGAWSPFEVGVHAIVAQELDLEEARNLLGALVEACGLPVPGLGYGLTRAFPSAAAVAEADLDPLDAPPTTARAVRAFALAVRDGALALDRSVTLDELVSSLTTLPGVGQRTAHELAARIGERDAFPASQPNELAEEWRPWRALAAFHLARPTH